MKSSITTLRKENVKLGNTDVIKKFVEHLIEHIKKNGIKSECYYGADEVESDVIDMIWDAYYKY